MRKPEKPLPPDVRCLHCGGLAVLTLPGAITDTSGKVLRQEEIPLCAKCLAQIEASA